MKNIYLLNKIKSITFFLLSAILLFGVGCDDNEEGWADERYLTDFEYSAYHTNPITGEAYTAEELDALDYNPFVEEHYFEGQPVELTFVSQKKPKEVKLLAGKDFSLIYDFTSFNQVGEGYESEMYSSSLEDLGFIEDGDKGTIQVKAVFEDGSIGSVDFVIKRIAEKIETFVYLKTMAGETIPLRIDENVTSRTDSPEYGSIVEFVGAAANRVEVTDESSIAFRHTENYSIGFWVNPGATGSDPVMVGDQDWDSSNNPGVTIAHQGDSWRAVSSVDGSIKPDGESPYTQGEWHFLMVTLDRTGNMTMYQDGTSVFSASMAGIGNTASGNNLHIGQDGTGAYGKNFEGLMGDVYIYDYALTAEEVLDAMGGPAAGPPTGVQLKTQDGFVKNLEVLNNGAAESTEEDRFTFTFEGGTNVEILEDLDFMVADDFSFSFWTKYSDMPSDPSLIGNKDWGSGDNTGILLAYQSSGNMKLNNADLDAAVRSDVSTSIATNDDAWHFVTVTFDRDGNAIIYIDGQADGSTSLAGIDDLKGSLPLRIGNDGTGGYDDFIGKIADVVIYDYVLSAGEIAIIKAAVPVSGVKLKNESGLVRNLEVSNSGAVESTEEDRFTFNFEGGTNVEILHGLDFMKADDFSFSFWTKYSDMSGDPSFIGNKDWGSGGNTGILLAYSGAEILLNTADFDADVRSDVETSVATNDDAWHFVTVTFDRDDNATVYIDGEADGSTTLAGIDDLKGNLPLRIGQDGTGSYGYDFIGKIADVIIYDYVLTLEQITAIYNE